MRFYKARFIKFFRGMECKYRFESGLHPRFFRAFSIHMLAFEIYARRRFLEGKASQLPGSCEHLHRKCCSFRTETCFGTDLPPLQRHTSRTRPLLRKLWSAAAALRGCGRHGHVCERRGERGSSSSEWPDGTRTGVLFGHRVAGRPASGACGSDPGQPAVFGLSGFRHFMHGGRRCLGGELIRPSAARDHDLNRGRGAHWPGYRTDSHLDDPGPERGIRLVSPFRSSWRRADGSGLDIFRGSVHANESGNLFPAGREFGATYPGIATAASLDALGGGSRRVSALVLFLLGPLPGTFFVDFRRDQRAVSDIFESKAGLSTASHQRRIAGPTIDGNLQQPGNRPPRES